MPCESRLMLKWPCCPRSAAGEIKKTRGRGGPGEDVLPGRKGMIRLTRDAIDYHGLTEQVRQRHCGAVVLFLGTVRDLTGESVTVALDYEAYPAMAEKKMAEIEAETRSRWPIGEMILEHRLGHLDVGD